MALNKNLEPVFKPETQPNGSVVVKVVTGEEARLALMNGLPFSIETRYSVVERPNGTITAVPKNGDLASAILSGRNYSLPGRLKRKP